MTITHPYPCSTFLALISKQFQPEPWTSSSGSVFTHFGTGTLSATFALSPALPKSTHVRVVEPHSLCRNAVGCCQFPYLQVGAADSPPITLANHTAIIPSCASANVTVDSYYLQHSNDENKRGKQSHQVNIQTTTNSCVCVCVYKNRESGSSGLCHSTSDQNRSPKRSTELPKPWRHRFTHPPLLRKTAPVYSISPGEDRQPRKFGARADTHRAVTHVRNATHPPTSSSSFGFRRRKVGGGT